MQVIVLGMHRSGTSMLSRLLNMMGLYFGTEGSSTGFNEENPKGFWERQDIRKLNDYILQKNGFEWNKIAGYEGVDQFSDETKNNFLHEAKKVVLGMDAFRPWFFKEPRFCLNLPLWTELLEVPIIIFVYRDPYEVAKSLQIRNGFPIEYGLAMWERYNELALKNSEGLPRMIVNHRALINDPIFILKGIKKFLERNQIDNLRLPTEKEVFGFIEKKLHRNKSESNNQFNVSPSQEKLLKLIEVNEDFTNFYTAKESFDALRNYEKQMDDYNSLKREIDQLKTSQSLLVDKIQYKDDEIHKIKQLQVSQQTELNEQHTLSLNQIKKSFQDQLNTVQQNLQLKKNEVFQNQLEYERRIADEKNERFKSEILQRDLENKQLDELLRKKEQDWTEERDQLNKQGIKFKEERDQLNKQQIRLKEEINKLKKGNEQILANLEKRLREKENLLKSKDILITTYWNQIQEMRISKRLKRLFLFENIKSIVKKPIWRLKVLKYRWSIFRKAKAIEKFVEKTFDHSLVTDRPLVSIIILNRDGVNHLRRLFNFLIKNTIYKNFEIFVFDNKSSDDSINFLNELKLKNLKIIQNNFNDTFSSANNKAASEAKGELLLFLNNDVMPLYGWLNQLVKSHLSNKNVGLVGAKLVYPKDYKEKDTLKVQHNGIGFKSEPGFLRPFNLDNKKEFFDLNHSEDRTYPSVTAACVLVRKEIFDSVGGFDESYNYGYEDVDLGLKLFTKGYKNIVANGSILFHNEFGTQNVQDSEVVKARRKRNLEHFRNKWYRNLLNQSWEDKLNGSNRLSLKFPRLTIGITVTEQGEYARAGDYFTAKELATEFEKLGFSVRFYAQKEENWYELHEDVDLLLVLLHGYDLSKIVTKNKNLIKAAWIRNWFDKFSDSIWFDKYDLVFSSSKKACDYIESEKLKKAYYLPIATNENRFSLINLKDDNFTCDFCFTGSFWNDPREIIQFLNPEHLSEYTFHIYGKNWDQVPKLASYSKGFVKYEDMPKVYSNTKILIDDANRVTKPWGSVNSRVFDALMSGVLVFTNGMLGSKDVFDGKLPIYSNGEELEQLIRFYLDNEVERLKKIKELQEIVKLHHTYRHRANMFKEVLSTYYKESLVIKIPVPKMEVAHQWGDYHFAKSLKKEFEKKNIRTKIELLYDWDSPSSFEYENVLVLRGLSIYKPKKFQVNLMWNISHPDKVDLDEYLQYDHVFIASEKWKEYLKDKGLDKVSTLLQCTDPDVFKIPKKSEYIKSDLLFVGNSRGVFRKIISDLLPTKHDLSIYGGGWKGLVENQYLKGEYIDNKELYKYYGGAKILLNDHWDDMREKGFISNRIFDALACGAVVVSDNVEGVEALESDQVYLYKRKNSLKKLLNDLINNGNKKSEARKARQFIIQNHTFKVRAGQILKLIQDK